MSAANESHTITVARLPGEEEDDLEYSTTCPPTGKSCNVWWECGTCEKAKRPITEDEEGDGEYTDHGVYHRQIDGYWMTKSSQCGLTTDSAQEECWDVAQLVGLGTHDVELDYCEHAWLECECGETRDVANEPAAHLAHQARAVLAAISEAGTVE